MHPLRDHCAARIIERPAADRISIGPALHARRGLHLLRTQPAATTPLAPTC